MALAREIVEFWFGPLEAPTFGSFRAQWFTKDPSFDQEIREWFLPEVEDAAAGRLDYWRANAEGALALVLLLDQFPRNLFRGSPRAWENDPKAREVANAALEAGFDRRYPGVVRWFFYLPFEHSENLDDQRRSVALFQSLEGPEHAEGVRYAIRHQEIIERFGRFPHRNEVLGRPSTPEEMEFLKEPDSSF